MYHKIGCDVKIAAIRLHERSLLDLNDILNCCKISRSTWFCVLKLWQETGNIVSNNNAYCAQARLLNFDNMQYLCQLVKQNPNFFLDELLNLLKANRFISVHYTTIHNQILRAGHWCRGTARSFLHDVSR